MKLGEKVLISWLFVSALAVPALPKAKVAGSVMDSEGAAIAQAYIIVHWDSSGSSVGLTSNVGIRKDLVLRTDRSGAYAAELPPGFYDVFVSAKSFTPTCRKVRIKKEQTFVYNAELKADALVGDELGHRLTAPRK